MGVKKLPQGIIFERLDLSLFKDKYFFFVFIGPRFQNSVDGGRGIVYRK
jgi:hypothetical protein